MTRYITALEVKDGDIITTEGFRCRVSDVEHYENGTVARYTLHSAPSDWRPRCLPAAYEGMRSGGNCQRIITLDS